MSFIVIEGEHKDPNDMNTLDIKTRKEYGPFQNEDDANDLCKSLIQKNIDNFYHRAWVIKQD